MKANIPKINYITYHRKSSEGEDKQIQSLERQLDETNKLIEAYQISGIVETISESRSAKIPHNRPGFDRMIKLIKQEKANGIVCWHANRLARNPYEWGVIQQLLIDKKLLSIVTKDREYKPEDNVLIMSVESGLSSQYSRDLGSVVKSGLEKKLSQGHPPCRAYLGYLNTKSSIRGSNTVIKDPERWTIMRKGFDMILSQAYTVRETLDVLNSQYNLRTRKGLKDGNKPLSLSGFYRILNNPFYYGYFKYNSQLYKGSYPAMITPVEFDLIQQILGKDGRPRKKHHTFNFTGLMKCGSCAAAITASKKIKLIKTTNRFKEYIFYHCTKRKANAKCSIVCHLHDWQIEQMIINELNQYDIKECFRNWALSIVQERHEEEANRNENLIEIQKKEQAKITQDINRLLDLRISDEISADEYKQKKLEKDEALARMQTHTKQLESSSERWSYEMESNLDFVCNVINKFKNGDATIKKEICHKFGWNWTLIGKKLLIDKQEWLEPLKKYKNRVESIFGTLEPQKTFNELGQNASLQTLRPIVRALEEEVRTSPPPKPFQKPFQRWKPEDAAA